jgi:HD-like signal output (HDOD) protein
LSFFCFVTTFTKLFSAFSMSYQCTSPGCPNATANLPREAAESLNFKCFLCEGDLVEPGVTLDEILEQVDILPVSLQILPKLQVLLNNDDVSLDVIATTTRMDASLVSRLVHVANSAYYSLAHGGSCSSVEQALSRIGLNKAYSVVGFVAAKQVYSEYLAIYSMSGDELWEKSVRTAYCMEKLSTQLFVSTDSYEYPDPSMAYTAGLLWSVGKMVISEFHRKGKSSALNEVIPPMTDEKEREILGFTNLDITLALMEGWRFPPEMITAIRFKDKPLLCTDDRPLACLLSLVIQAVEDFPVTDEEVEEINLQEYAAQFQPDDEALNVTGIPKMEFMEVIVNSIQFVKMSHIIGQLK